MATVDVNIRIDFETDYNELVLDVGKVTLGEKNRNSMKDKQRRKRQKEAVSRAMCALLNSGGGVIKAEIENTEYKYNEDGIGEDLEISFSDMLPRVLNYLDFMQNANTFLIFVKSWSLDSSGQQIVMLRTNLYSKNITSTIVMDGTHALAFLQEKKTGSRLFSTPKTNAMKVPTDVHEESSVVDSPSEFFSKTKLTYRSKVNFSESTLVATKLVPDYDVFGKKEKRKREDVLEFIKEEVPQYVSAFANTDGGYLFFGIDSQTKEVSGFEVQPWCLSEIEKTIRELPVQHFCKEKKTINYSCKLIEVHDEERHRGYVCALHVDRFCCAVFVEEPDSWHVKGNQVMWFTTEEWIKCMVDGEDDEATPDITNNCNK
ncbi:ribonuclease SLFN12-like isoform X1 [Marmota flaviventris]|uniref:ribonuclease SLFN12-like isoform X1 n=1 Tax=Marmota flaviventris TaxID=93162 RepID=UPI000FFF9A52|nr:schlafen family member 12-like isoform X1 [Marmota flaviventris]XP_027779363.1 schlafen family member 12-like isoform X1 [Marmota flaviventris]